MTAHPVGEDVRLIIDTDAGRLLDAPLITVAVTARVGSGKVMEFLYQLPADPDAPDDPRPLRRATLAIVADEIVEPAPCERCGEPKEPHGSWALGHLYAGGFVIPDKCAKCKKPFDPDDPRYIGRARYKDTPYCRDCMSRCQDIEIADHRCVICA